MSKYMFFNGLRLLPIDYEELRKKLKQLDAAYELVRHDNTSGGKMVRAQIMAAQKDVYSDAEKRQVPTPDPWELLERIESLEEQLDTLRKEIQK